MAVDKLTFLNLLPSTEFLMQGVPGGKVNILGGYSIGHPKQKTLYEQVSYSERFPRYSHLNANRKIVDKKEILQVRTVSNFYLWGWMKSEVYRKKVDTRD